MKSFFFCFFLFCFASCLATKILIHMAHSVCAWHCISDTFWRKVGSWMTIEKKGEKKTGQEPNENERRESKRRWWGGDWKWKDDPVCGWLPLSSTTGWWSRVASLGKKKRKRKCGERNTQIRLRPCIRTWTVLDRGTTSSWAYFHRCISVAFLNIYK